ncbi:abortive infection family protein [Burkholderia contaminans]|uniref:abortive infection family protein n=1 Tax=Burkholderia contaminans TaxID=488447 RepID=UPI0015A6B38F
MPFHGVVRDGHGSCSNDPACEAFAIDADQVIIGPDTIIQGLGTTHNKMSDSHSATYMPASHQAKLAVNCAITTPVAPAVCSRPTASKDSV